MLCFLSPADEGARAAGQTKRARPLLPLRRRADRAGVWQTSSHGHGRVVGSPAEGQRGRPIAHHIFREGAPRPDQEPPRGQRTSGHGKHAGQGGQFTRSDPLSKPLPFLRHPPALRLSGTQDLQVSGWDRSAYRQPCWSLSRVLGCFCFSLPLFFSTPGTSSPFVLLCIYLCPSHSSSPSSSSSFTSGTGPISTWPDFVFTGASGGPVQLREKAPCTETEVGSRCFHTGQGSIGHQYHRRARTQTRPKLSYSFFPSLSDSSNEEAVGTPPSFPSNARQHHHRVPEGTTRPLPQPGHHMPPFLSFHAPPLPGAQAETTSLSQLHRPPGCQGAVPQIRRCGPSVSG